MGGKHYSDSGAGLVSDILRSPVVWCVLKQLNSRTKFKTKDKLLHLTAPITKKEA